MSIYRDRMLGYYPIVISSITDIQAIVDSEYPEFEDLDDNMMSILDDCWLTEDASEARIAQWENALDIPVVTGSTLSDRRDTIIARLRGGGKLNTARIESIVQAFTGGTAVSYIQNSVLYVGIQPPPGNRNFIFSNVEQEIGRLVPAHIGLSVFRNYRTWAEAKTLYPTWNDMTSDTWFDVVYP